MKKKFLDNQVMESVAKQVERDWSNQKIHSLSLSEKDLLLIKDNLIKGEKMMQIEHDQVVVESDFHRTSIESYEEFFLITEQLNFFGKPKMQKTNYYKIIRK